MKAIINLIKNKNLTFFDFLYKKYNEMLINLGFSIMKKNFSFLNLERNDFCSLAYQTCHDLWKINENTILKNGIEKVLKMQLVQKVILLARKNKTQGNYILNNYISPPDYINDLYSNNEINYNRLEFDLILKNNINKINKLNKMNQLVFYDYFIENLTRKEISIKQNLSIKDVNQRINYLKKIIKNKFIK